MGNCHSDHSVTCAEDVKYRITPLLGLLHSAEPNVLLQIQCSMFHFRQFESKQITSKNIRIVLKHPNETVGDKENIDLC